MNSSNFVRMYAYLTELLDRREKYLEEMSQPKSEYWKARLDEVRRIRNEIEMVYQLQQDSKEVSL